MEITERDIGIVVGVVHNFPAVATSPVFSMESSDFHLFGSLMKHLDGKRFATDADDKQSATSLVQTLYPDTSRGAMHTTMLESSSASECLLRNVFFFKFLVLRRQ
jgi:hypothetical protein